MDIDRQKRKQRVRVIVTEIIMVLAVAGILGVLLAVVSGWRVSEDMSLEQSGMVQVDSLPTGATVTIDDERLFLGTNTSKMLPEGHHRVQLTKEGYDSWSREISIKPGWLLRLQYPRLFKSDRKQETVQKISGANFLSASPNRNGMLYGGDTPQWQWVNVRGDEARTTAVDLSSVVPVKDGKLAGSLKDLIWNGNGDRVLLKWDNGGGIEWILVDVDTPKVSMNLTKEFKASFTDVQFEAAGGDRLVAQDGKNLAVLVVASKEVEKLPLKDVEDFVVSDGEIAYIANVKDGRVVGLYRDGEDGGVEIDRVTEGGAKVLMALGNYTSEKYLYYTVNDKLSVYKGQNYPNYGSETKTMDVVLSETVGMVPAEELQVSWTGFTMVMRSGEQVVIFDAETDSCVSYSYPATQTEWLDDYALISVENGKLVIRDFDNNNVRTLIGEGVAQGYDAIVAANNRWMYYVAKNGDELELRRERLY